MTARGEVAAARPGRALRYGALTSALVLAVCAVLTVLAGTAFASAQATAGAATARTFGTITGADGAGVVLSWTPAGSAPRTDTVAVAGTPPPPGTRTEVAYDPAAPDRPLVPGAALLAGAERALGTLVLAGTVVALLLGTCGLQVVTRRRAAARPARSVPVRRVRVRNGMWSRSWLETDTAPRRWIPVHFDPVLVTLPAPATVRLRGDPASDRLVAAEIDGRVLHASGPVRVREPRGIRADNPTLPDDASRDRAGRLASLRGQVFADLPLMVPAPFVGLLWAYVDRGGVPTWAAATALTAALGLWLAAVRGSDPS